MPYIFGAETREGVKHSSHVSLSLSLSLPLIVFPFSPESGSGSILRAHFSARALKFPSGHQVPLEFTCGSESITGYLMPL